MSFSRFTNTGAGGVAGVNLNYYHGYKMRNTVEDNIIVVDGSENAVNTGSALSGYLFVFPIVFHNTTIDALMCEVTTAGSGTTVDLFIYDTTSDANGYPNNIVVSGQIDSSSTGVKIASVTPTILNGKYWIGYLALNGAPGLRRTNFANTNTPGWSTTLKAGTAITTTSGNAMYQNGISAVPDPYNLTPTQAGLDIYTLVVARGTRTDL